MKPEEFKEECKGCITLLPTPFGENDEVDYEALRDHTRYVVDNGVEGVIPAGSTGEFCYLSDEEHKRVIDVVVDEVDGDALVVAGTGKPGTRETIKMTKYAEDAGCDCAMIVTPYYFITREEGLFEHYKRIAESVDMAIMPYNNPWVSSGVRYSYDLVEKFAEEIPNIVAMKDVTGNPAYVYELIHRVGDKISILPYAETEHTMLCFLLGCPATISLVSNIAPDLSHKLWESAYLEKDAVGAMEVLGKLSDFNRLMNRLIDQEGIPTYLHLVKHALTLMDRPCGLPMRLPSVELKETEVGELKQALKRMGVLK